MRMISALLLGGVGLACLLSNQKVFLKLYPILMNAVALVMFGVSLFFPPPIIFRFAVLMDKSIPGSLAEKQIENYCRKVTLVWCGFFVLNGGIAAWTVFYGSDVVWSVYNGGISYVLMGLIFAFEYVIRRMVQKKLPKGKLPVDILDARDLSGITIIDQTPEKVILEFSVPVSSDYFNDHFPMLKVLPAVAQFELAVRMAHRYLSGSLQLTHARRLKFSALIRPDIPLRLELSRSASAVSFTYSCPDGHIVYSTGSFCSSGLEQ